VYKVGMKLCNKLRPTNNSVVEDVKQSTPKDVEAKQSKAKQSKAKTR